MKPLIKHRFGAAAICALVLATQVHAAVSDAEAAALKSTLTPLGAERAGNKDNAIPAWDGGFTGHIPDEQPGGRRGDPFKDEKPLFSITAKNAEQYADKLTDGVRAMLTKYPDSYRIDVYKTHRTATAPQWVYDNTYKNATQGRLAGDVPSGVFGGIPFPLPKSGAEVIWNHLLRWRGEAWALDMTLYQLNADGKRVFITRATAEQESPYYYKDNSPAQFDKTPEYWLNHMVNVSPPLRAGEASVAREKLDGESSQAWLYMTGQRRVRKLPNPCCDAPAALLGGTMSYDELNVWNGRLNRFDFKLVGKKEMFVPYNSNRTLQPTSDDQVLSAHHLNPDYVRWELHRVWVVEANVRDGRRHMAPKSRYYCDEDTWTCLLADRWDANGQLWKTLWQLNAVMPDVPGTVDTSFGSNDLLSGVAIVASLFNQAKEQRPARARHNPLMFTPDALAGEGVR